MRQDVSLLDLVFVPLVSGSHLFGDCHTRGVQEKLVSLRDDVTKMFPYAALSLVRLWIHAHPSVYERWGCPHTFCVMVGLGVLFARAVRTGKLDIIPRRFVSGTHLFGLVACGVLGIWIFLEMTSRNNSMFSVCLARQRIQVDASVFEEFVHFLCEGGLWTPRSTLVGLLSVLGGLFCCRNAAFSASVHLDVEAQVAGTPGV